jgi:hypothetical protein
MWTAYIMKIIQDFNTFYENCHHTNDQHQLSSHKWPAPTVIIQMTSTNCHHTNDQHQHFTWFWITTTSDGSTGKLNQYNCLHSMELNWGPAEHRSKAWTVQQDHVMALLLVPALSLGRPGFNLRSVHVWQVAFRVAVELVFFVWLFCVLSVSFIHSATDTLCDNSNCQSCYIKHTT